MTQIWESVQQYVPSLLGAVAVLIGGWLVAMFVAAAVRGALRRTTLDNRIAQWLAGDQAAKVPVEKIAGRVVFWLGMLFVIAAFFQLLGLTALTEPVNGLLNQVFEFAPRLGGALVLLLIAWVIASALRVVIRRVMEGLAIEKQVAERMEIEGAAEIPVAKAVGDAVYWLVFLLFLPAVLGTLALQGLLEPVQNLVNELVSYAPNVLAAAAIFGLGWLVAKMIQRIVVSLCISAGVDRLGGEVGLDKALGSQPLSRVIGFVVYVLVLIPVLIASLNTFGLEAVTGPASNMLDVFLRAVPALFAAGLILGLAYLIGKVVSTLAAGMLAGLGFDRILTKLGIRAADAPPEHRPSDVVGYLVLVAVMLFAAVEAVDLLGFASLAIMLTELMTFGANVLIGVTVFGFGLYLATLAAGAIRSTGSANAALLATGARVGILVLTGAMALRQIGVANEIITLAFGLTLGALAVALAIAFGIGGREIAAEQLAHWRETVRRG